MPLAAGTRLGVFEILAPLGKGGMSEVYRARDSKIAAILLAAIVLAGVARFEKRTAGPPRVSGGVAMTLAADNPYRGGENSCFGV